ncbi:MAG: phospho-N-acetylmuramoyl-pentapeptide-transferase [Ruminococcaceae bacterium]|nr:phospho-N-acetylmuramoyl-pentapeptide-transferase [Oscillospiraceae bacterium]
MNINIAAVLSFVLALGVTAVLGYFLIPVLHKLKFGQNILMDIGPKWHAKKQGTPTMGGIMFIIGIVFATAVALAVCKVTGFDAFSTLDVLRNQQMTRLFAGILMALCFALVGFADDYIKVVKKRNLGLTEIQKTVPQVLIIGCYLASLAITDSKGMYIPFFGKLALDSVPGMIFFFIFGVCVIYGAINAVNFTDGIDGLCGSVTIPVGMAFCVMGLIMKNTSVGILGAALAGGCVGYIFWNKYPAKVMMGDTGSMFLGGLVVALAYAIECPVILLPVGIVYVIEAMSDVIQIGSIKIRKKKVFKMAPIHHHFEMCGWNENKIVTVFTLVSTVGCAVGVVLMYLTVNK